MLSISFDARVSNDRDHESFRKSTGEGFNVLQKFKEILYHKEIQIALHKLGIYSSRNLSAIEDLKSNESASNSKEIVKMEVANSSGGQVYVNSRNAKVMQNNTDIDQLNQRLKILEEENKIMRQEFLEQVEERKQLVNEIYHHFQAIYHCLQFENSEYGERSDDEYYMMNPREEGLDAGLSGSCIVARDVNRANYKALKGNPEA